MIVLLGKRGSGKTWVLDYLRDACKRSVAIPYVYTDCEAYPDDSVWQITSRITDALNAEKWTDFGHLNFPRVTLGRLAVEHPNLPTDLKKAQEKLCDQLRAAARLRERSSRMGDLTSNVSQAVNVPRPMIAVVRWILRFATESPRVVEFLYRRGLRWYGARFGHSAHSGLSVLVELNRRFHSDDQRELAERMLCEAFLDDLTDAYARRRKFNCAALLDNCDTPAGTGLLDLLADLRAGHSDHRGHDPLVIVATSRTVPELTGLTHCWTLPWEPDRHDAARVPSPEEVDYDHWREHRAPRHEPASWWLPIHLRDLAHTELDPAQARLVHRLTGGHPWSTRRVLGLISTGMPPGGSPEAQLYTVLDGFAPHAEYLLADLPTTLRRILVLWSAARDVDTAASADLGGTDRFAAMILHDELVKRLWLLPDDRLPGMMRCGPRLHPWLRRILLHELAKSPDSWSQVNLQLGEYAASRSRPLDVAYHALARGELSPVVDYLAGQFRRLDADSWIQEFDAVTAAPRSQGNREAADERYDTLMLGRSAHDQQDRVRNTMWSMVAARWIWSDPTGDPTFALTTTIADGYVRLAEEAQAGLARYRREAQAYREMRTR